MAQTPPTLSRPVKQAVYDPNTLSWVPQEQSAGVGGGGDASAANQAIEITELGAVTETAPATDTASSGLNGRLQRVAQRLTSLIALVPSALSNGFFQVSLKETITVPVTGIFFQSTQPISAASLPLPTGAALETTQALQLSRADTFKTRSDIYTTTANGVTVDTSTSPLSTYSIQVKGTGAGATTWDIRLEGSLDGVNFSQILQHTNTTGDGAVLWIGSSSAPSLYFRSRCAGLVLGGASNVVVTILGKAD